MEVRVTRDGNGLKNFRCALFHGLDQLGLVGVAYTDENGMATIEIEDDLGTYAHMQLFITGCDAWPQTITLELASTDENMMSNVAIYPNPNKGRFNINLPEEDYVIVVSNSVGQQVFSQQAKGKTTLNLEGLTHGVYFVTVKSEKAVSTLKFVKE